MNYFRSISGFVVLLSTFVPLSAQWLNLPTKGIPRTKDGKPDLSAPAPKAADGHPDLSGIWWLPIQLVEGPGRVPVPKYALNLAADLKPEDVPMLPWADAFVKKNLADLLKDLPLSRCLPPGIPLSYTLPLPSKIFQMPDVIVILQESSNSYRQIFTDGRKLPEDPNPSWVGYSAGRWEGDTLVVESSGFNDRTQLDALHPHSEALHLTERYRRRDLGHMEIEMTVNDPKTYTKPWTVKLGMELITEGDLLESVCNENEKDVSHLVGK